MEESQPVTGEWRSEGSLGRERSREGQVSILLLQLLYVLKQLSFPQTEVKAGLHQNYLITQCQRIPSQVKGLVRGKLSGF